MTLEEAKQRIYELDSGSIFYCQDYEAGFSDAQNMVLGILEEIDTEPVGNPDKLTLTELAHELRKIFRFKYLTVSDTNGLCINVWKYFKPECEDGKWIGRCLAFDIYPEELVCGLGFSGYTDADGDVDFSKCIVEVEE